MTRLFSFESLSQPLALILHDLILICTFAITHPLILVYLLLLSPYLQKLFSFLCPLLFSTFLLAFTFHIYEIPSATPEFSLTTYSAVISFLSAKLSAKEVRNSLTEQLFSMIFSWQIAAIEDCNSEIFQRGYLMRKEKQWKRTLACKLFEERMACKLCDEIRVIVGSEQMDLLWEAYEVDSHKVTKASIKEEEEEEWRERVSEKLCCLQALKLSAGKMNLGVGRRMWMKISMAMKVVPLFHREERRRKKIVN